MDKRKKWNFYKMVRSRVVIVGTCFVLAGAGLLYQVFSIKINKGEDFQKQVLELMSSKENVITPQRGSILDRSSQTLANSVLSYNVVLDPMAILNYSEQTQNHIEQTLSKHLNISKEEIHQGINKNPASRYFLLSKEVRVLSVEALKKENLKGVWFEETYTRNYPKDTLAAQLIGFYSTSGKGQYGIEQHYEEILAGTEGRSSSKIHEQQLLINELTPAVQGSSVVLTLDTVIQEYIEKAMKPYIEEYQPLNATALFMNPNSGEIYGMYSYPSFNPSTYTTVKEQVGPEKWSKATDVERTAMVSSAWKNHTMQYTYEPGSTFKPLFVAAAMDEGIVHKDDHFHCNGWNQVGVHTIHCWKRGGHGTQTLEQALANSCNVAMMKIAENMESSVFKDYMMRYGLGQPTGVDLPGEEVGLLHPTLSKVDKATHSMGQGFTLTPLQLTTAFSALINGGTLYKPYLTSRIIQPNGTILENKPTVTRNVISEETSKILTEMLQSVVTHGTGRDAGVVGYDIAGKTGTSQKLPRSARKYVISFIGYAPIENPQIVGLITFDEVPDTSGLPKKAFSDIMQNVLPYLRIQTTEEGKQALEDELMLVPNLKGKTIYEARNILNEKGWHYELVGVGTHIDKHYPQEAEYIPKGNTIKLYTSTQSIDSISIVPNLIGLKPEDAEVKVQKLFKLKGSVLDTITNQFPKGGAKIEKGQPILIW